MSTRLIEPTYGLSIAHFLTHLIPWQFKVCGPGLRHEALVEHIDREIREVDAATARTHQQEELVDIVILSLEGAWRVLMGAEHDPLKGASIAATIEDSVLEQLLISNGRTASLWLPNAPQLRRQLAHASLHKTFLFLTCEALTQILMLSYASGADRPWVATRELLYAKLNRNVARTWPDWRAVPAGTPIEHVGGE